MNAADMTLTVFALATLAAYVCRLDALQWRTHRASIILLHLLGGASAAWGLVQAADGAATAGCWLAVGFAASWLWVSWFSWSAGVPAHFRRERYASPRPAHPAGFP